MINVRWLRYEESWLRVLTLLTVLALYLAVVSRFRTFLGKVTDFFTVAAFSYGWVTWLITLLRHVSFLTAVPAGLSSFGWAIFGKVSHYSESAESATGRPIYPLTLVAILTLYIGGRAWFGTFSRLVAGLSAVTTRKFVFSCCGAVTSAVSQLVAVHALDNNQFSLHLVLGTGLGDVAKLCALYQPSFLAQLWRKLSPSQLEHLGMPRSTGIPASSKRFEFSSRLDGQPCFRARRWGWSLKKKPTVYLQSSLPCKFISVKVEVTSFSLSRH